jgi:hypothetical protein
MKANFGGMTIASAVFASIVVTSGCGGRVADPVPTYRAGDEQMTCSDLKSEMAFIEAEVNKLIPESKKTGKNVALGAAGLFLIFPWFFMDMSDAEKTEIRAYNERYLALEKLYRKNCVDGEEGQRATDRTAAERLKLLDELKAEGLITEDEYIKRRNQIISEL